LGVGVTAILSARRPDLVMSRELFEGLGARTIAVVDTDNSSAVENVECILEELVAEGRADSERRVRQAVGEVSDLERRVYQGVLIDTMVHEFNLLRGVLGEPTELEFASLRDTTTTVVLDFGGTECVVAWLDLPGIARYEMEVCFYDPAERVRLAFPSPYLKNAPRAVEIETGESGGPASVAARELVSYEESFKLELLEFYSCIVEGTEPLTSGSDGLRDIALCQSVVAASSSGGAVVDPTSLDVTP